jgi:hypothetical protein
MTATARKRKPVRVDDVTARLALAKSDVQKIEEHHAQCGSKDFVRKAFGALCCLKCGDPL